jgi:hypothetical protein
MGSVCFFARVRDAATLERAEFYAQEIRLLREFGFEVHVATNLFDLPAADLQIVAEAANARYDREKNIYV